MQSVTGSHCRAALTTCNRAQWQSGASSRTSGKESHSIHSVQGYDRVIGCRQFLYSWHPTLLRQQRCSYRRCGGSA
jgi:hypothetical protein